MDLFFGGLSALLLANLDKFRNMLAAKIVNSSAKTIDLAMLENFRALSAGKGGFSWRSSKKDDK